MARWFTKGRFHYPEPERLNPTEARTRRLDNLLERERRYQDVPNFTFVQERLRAAGLSRVAKNIVNEDTRSVVKGRRLTGPKAASIAAALATFKERDFQDPAKRKLYRALRRAQQVPEVVAPSGSDKRRFNPSGKDHASTIYGTAARLTGVRHMLGHSLNANSWVPSFLMPQHVVPCVERMVRREVMFAKKKAGVGYRTKKRRTWQSGIPC